MGESLYAVLDIDPDASADAVESAYRDRVKTHHPDVSDAPDAGRRFKRLTFARDTLVDETERARYDRLGHAAYVEDCAPPGLFDTGPATSEAAVEPATASASAEEATAADGGPAQWRASASTADTRQGSSAGADQSPTAATIYGSQSAGTPGHRRTANERGGPLGALRHILRALGAWAVVHVLLLVSAAVTGWFALTTSLAVELSLPGLLFVLVIAVAALSASALHVVTTLYAT